MSASTSASHPAEPQSPSARAARRVLDRPGSQRRSRSPRNCQTDDRANRHSPEPLGRSPRTYHSALRAAVAHSTAASHRHRRALKRCRGGCAEVSLRGPTPLDLGQWQHERAPARPIRDDQVEWAGRKRAARWKLPEGPASSGRCGLFPISPLGLKAEWSDQVLGAYPLR